jgi:hypothetical protein
MPKNESGGWYDTIIIIRNVIGWCCIAWVTYIVIRYILRKLFLNRWRRAKNKKVDKDYQSTANKATRHKKSGKNNKDVEEDEDEGEDEDGNDDEIEEEGEERWEGKRGETNPEARGKNGNLRQKNKHTGKNQNGYRGRTGTDAGMTTTTTAMNGHASNSSLKNALNRLERGSASGYERESEPEVIGKNCVISVVRFDGKQYFVKGNRRYFVFTDVVPFFESKYRFLWVRPSRNASSFLEVYQTDRIDTRPMKATFSSVLSNEGCDLARVEVDVTFYVDNIDVVFNEQHRTVGVWILKKAEEGMGSVLKATNTYLLAKQSGGDDRHDGDGEDVAAAAAAAAAAAIDRAAGPRGLASSAPSAFKKPAAPKVPGQDEELLRATLDDPILEKIKIDVNKRMSARKEKEGWHIEIDDIRYDARMYDIEQMKLRQGYRDKRLEKVTRMYGRYINKIIDTAERAASSVNIPTERDHTIKHETVFTFCLEELRHLLRESAI